MAPRLNYAALLLTVCLFHFNLCKGQAPFLQQKGETTQLIVEGQPFIILGGELGNSSASAAGPMRPIWPKLKAMNLNTVLVPVYWELIESREGAFDLSLPREAITEARRNGLKLVFLWFGSWKNSMSCYAPAWVKLGFEQYPRARDAAGRSQEILSPFSRNVLEADKRAFEQLMRFIRDFDGETGTVLMVQVENEIGMLPSARDHSPLANEAFDKAVPAPLIEYLQQHKAQLAPTLHEAWRANGYKTSGNWEAVFGKGLHTDEIFMAWFYAVFTNEIAEAGKKIYPLPMFVNAALNRPNRKPGEYPSAGPLPHLMDVWKAAGPAIDFLAPDFYNPDFELWCERYARRGNPLFIPEHAFDASVAAKALYAVAQYDALGFSPFAIESTERPGEEPLGKMYALIRQLMPLITARQVQGAIRGALASKAAPETVLQLGRYELNCRHGYTLSWTPGARLDDWPMTSAIIIQTGEDEFYVAGSGIVITFELSVDKNTSVGLLKVEEGRFEGREWKVERHLNGDQTHQGRHLSIPVGEYSIQRVQLYTYK
ncbi:MAG: DUF5597 domain-containing protein [Phaeodactylibacter sp.]|nr:DUF5597 domain-containing protein [Phaeodactylibacter sp.]MCB9277117.1 DUF5597 domain-containing protein [Lewinellaceae bacterium]